MTNMIKTISPINGEVYVERPLAATNEIDDTLIKARLAQQAWSAKSVAERAQICTAAVDAFVANKDVIAKELTWQMGRPIRYSQGEVGGYEERARYMIGAAEEALAPLQLEEKAGFTRYIKREALGVVFVVAPWNFPFMTAINAVMPALMAGNAVVLKHSAQTPLCAERMVESFEKAGLPAGVFQYLHLSHADTESIIASDKVDYVAFTGSVAGGEMVEKAAAGTFKGTGLELGGKDPAYVRADANIDQAVDTAIDGAFFNSGQSCCGIERIYVHESVYDEFVEKAVALVNGYVLGRSDDESTTLGPVVKASSADFIQGQIDEAIEQGAVAHIDSKAFAMAEKGTPYLAPQVLTNVDHSMRIMQEESFGPVVGIQKVADDEAAITLMNDSEFGLTASVFTTDVEAGIAVGERLETGTFFINRCDYLDPALAWTGVKNSGKGCTLSSLGYDYITRPKSFHIKLP
ncbi:succinate semialdehyde dehydrogenase [Marinomonas sp. MED121]|uniref:aldehyde dehydrogenase family protein n=1 Tax=Marinomonas sp. MED121 TaxID=314277 RepID=UPI000069122D|nr:aldehyde dehydrogenase family protein [Marinomonas sp. MED121]EAQ67773.1 succinate semialdehyde dehydrogenase [Marinomonas sp. MED121]